MTQFSRKFTQPYDSAYDYKGRIEYLDELCKFNADRADALDAEAKSSNKKLNEVIGVMNRLLDDLRSNGVITLLDERPSISLVVDNTKTNKTE